MAAINFKNTFSSNYNSKRNHDFWFYGFLLIFIFQFNSYKAQREVWNPNGLGLIFDAYVSGNAHGTIYSGSLSYTKNRSTLSMGPCIQKRNMKLDGGKIAYSYWLNAPRLINKRVKLLKIKETSEFENEEPEDEIEEDMADDGLQIKLFTYVQYLNNAPLSYNAEKLENHVNRIENQNWKSTTLSTIEGGLGFELNVKIAANLYWRNYIAASVFYHTKYINNMQHDQCAPVLTIGTSINIPNFK